MERLRRRHAGEGARRIARGAQRPAPLPHGLGDGRDRAGADLQRRAADAKSRRSRSDNAGDLARTPYTDRTIARTNAWRWKRGRRVFELVAPGGDVYVMQSYSQIVDPELTLAKLRKLGKRLRLPDGLALPHAAAETRARPERERRGDDHPGRPAEHLPAREDHATAGQTPPAPGGDHWDDTQRSAGTTPGTVEDRGTVTGTPFGDGSVVVIGSLAGGRLTATFRLRSSVDRWSGPSTCRSRSAATGSASAAPRRSPAGRAPTAASRAVPLRARDTNTLDGQNGRVYVRGHVRY